MSRQGSVRWRGAQVGLVLAATLAIVVALALLRAGGSGSGVATGVGAPGASASAVAPTPPGRLPQGLEDRGWIAEIAGRRFIAGTLSGRVMALPAGENALTATSTTVVSVLYLDAGARTSVRVRDIAGGRLRASVELPITVASAVVVRDTVYVSGNPFGSNADAGVQAISLTDGSVRDVIPPSPATGPEQVVRNALVLSASGSHLASSICVGDTCATDVVDLATGNRTTPVHDVSDSAIALSDETVYLINELATVVTALDSTTGVKRWTLGDAQIGGVMATADGSRAIIASLPNRPNGGQLTFTLTAADAVTGARQTLLQRPADVQPPTFYPRLSGDRFAVISTDGSLEDFVSLRRQLALSLVDARTGSVQPNAVTLTAP